MLSQLRQLVINGRSEPLISTLVSLQQLAPYAKAAKAGEGFESGGSANNSFIKALQPQTVDDMPLSPEDRAEAEKRLVAFFQQNTSTTAIRPKSKT